MLIQLCRIQSSCLAHVLCASVSLDIALRLSSSNTYSILVSMCIGLRLLVTSGCVVTHSDSSIGDDVTTDFHRFFLYELCNTCYTCCWVSLIMFLHPEWHFLCSHSWPWCWLIFLGQHFSGGGICHPASWQLLTWVKCIIYDEDRTGTCLIIACHPPRLRNCNNKERLKGCPLKLVSY